MVDDLGGCIISDDDILECLVLWKANIALSALYSMKTNAKPRRRRKKSTTLSTGVLAGAIWYRAGKKRRKAEYGTDKVEMGPGESSAGG